MLSDALKEEKLLITVGFVCIVTDILIAEGFIKELAGDEIKRKLSVKRILVFFISAVLLIWAVFAVVSLIDVHSDSHGYFTEEILHIQNIWGGGAL